MKERILKLTGHKSLYFTKRGNESIKLALKYCKSKGFSNLYIADQGGWMTYPQIGKKLGFDVFRFSTDYGLIEELDIEKGSVLLYANPAGYIIEQDMKKIYSHCKEKGIFVVCDISGGIGEDYVDGNYADAFICSFGKWKPVWIGEGGFASFKEDVKIDFEEFNIDDIKLSKALDELPSRMKKLHSICGKIKSELKEYKIIHPEGNGIVVAVKFKDEDEKKKILDYCSSNKYEYEICPREIRVLEDAVCIEVKRIR